MLQRLPNSKLTSRSARSKSEQAATMFPSHRVAVVIATRGRPDVLANVVRHLSQQTLPPAHIYIVGSQPSDIALVDTTPGNVTTIVGRTGSAHQRNDGLDLAGNDFDSILFIDDDFVPSRFWLERMAHIFDTRPAIMGVSGVILADGTTTEGITFKAAEAMVATKDAENANGHPLADRFPYGGNVGCNMAYRASAVRDIRFDESLPLYAWHEDSDFRGQVERKGFFAKSDDLWGVHLGHKLGRSSGTMLGYAQIANSIYLARKGTVPKDYMLKLAIKNLLANALHSISPEPYVDRRGRLRGNLRALGDLLLGRLSPSRASQL